LERLLLHSQWCLDDVVDAVTGRFPDIEIHHTETYDGMVREIDAFKPTIIYSIRGGQGPFPREAILGSDSVHWFSNGGVGIDHLRPWDPDRLTVTNSAGVSGEAMAQYIIGGLIALCMRFPQYWRDKAARRWDIQKVTYLAGKTLAVIGLGGTGARVVPLARAMGMRVIGVRANPRPMEGVDRVAGLDDLDAILAEADAIAVCVPLTDQTRHLIDARALGLMKPGVLLADVSRGGVVDQIALNAALDDGHVAGAVLDVFEPEPLPADSPLWAQPNAILTPHSSAEYTGWERNSAIMFCDNLDRYLAGEQRERVVDPGRGY